METKSAVETNEAYHADTTHVSASMLKDLDDSPRIFHAKHIAKTLRTTPSASMEFGTAVHCATLEPELFETQYVVQPPECSDRRRKSYKDWAATVHPSQTILKQDVFESVLTCRDRLQTHPIIRMALQADGPVELSHRWTCIDTGVDCKFRPDKICPQAGIVLDIKTMQACSERDFADQVSKFRYHLQSAHYMAGACDAYPERDDWVFVFACVETSEPYRCRAFELPAEVIDLASDKRLSLLSEYRSRMESGDWSEPQEAELVTVEFSNWQMKRMA